MSDQFSSLDDLQNIIEAADKNVAQIAAQDDNETPQDNETTIVSAEVKINNEATAVTPVPESVVPPVEIPQVTTNHNIEAFLTSEDKEMNSLMEKVDGLERQEDVLITRSRSEYLAQFEKSKDVRQKIDNAMSHTFDLNDLSILPTNNQPLVVEKNFEVVSKTSFNPTFPVINLKSGYRAFMSALTNNEKIQYLNMSGSAYDRTYMLLKLVWKKMENTSIDNRRISLDEFLNITAEDDFQTVLYGIYHSTFPDKVTYNVTCPHCRSENKIPLLPSNLIEVLDVENAKRYVNEVLENFHKGREFLSESMVANPVRIMCPESKVVFELRTSTLRHLLDSMNAMKKFSEQYAPDMINLTKHIGKCYVPDVDSFATGKPAFFDHSETGKVLRVLDFLSKADLTHVRKTIARMIRSYQVRFVLPEFNCASSQCSKLIDKQEMDLINILFLAIDEVVSQ